MKAFLLNIVGDVQGVSYRYFARNEAKKIGLTGWAKNEHDGSVSVFIQGQSEKIDNFIAWAKEGSPMSKVDKVQITKSEALDGLKGFEVK